MRMHHGDGSTRYIHVVVATWLRYESISGAAAQKMFEIISLRRSSRSVPPERYGQLILYQKGILLVCVLPVLSYFFGPNDFLATIFSCDCHRRMDVICLLSYTQHMLVKTLIQQDILREWVIESGSVAPQRGAGKTINVDENSWGNSRTTRTANHTTPLEREPDVKSQWLYLICGALLTKNYMQDHNMVATFLMLLHLLHQLQTMRYMYPLYTCARFLWCSRQPKAKAVHYARNIAWFSRKHSDQHFNTLHFKSTEEYFRHKYQTSSANSRIYHSGKVSASQLEGWAFDPQTLSESPWRFLGKSVHLTRLKQISGFDLPPITSPKNVNWNIWPIITVIRHAGVLRVFTTLTNLLGGVDFLN